MYSIDSQTSFGGRVGLFDDFHLAVAAAFIRSSTWSLDNFPASKSHLKGTMIFSKAFSAVSDENLQISAWPAEAAIVTTSSLLSIDLALAMQGMANTRKSLTRFLADIFSPFVNGKF